MSNDVPEGAHVISTATRVSASPLITAPSQRLATQAGRRGFDMARQIVEDLRTCVRKGQSPDLILISKKTDYYLNTAWLEIGMPRDQIPCDIAGVQYRVADDLDADYLFLRDYIPWEKQRAKAEGIILYGEGKKKLIGVSN